MRARPDCEPYSLVRLATSLRPFGAPHGGLTDLFFLVLCKDSKSHLQVLARLGRMLQLPEFGERLRDTEDSQTAYEIICETERQIAGQDGG